MAGFFSKFLDMFSSNGNNVAVDKRQVIGDCTVFATPMREGSQFRLAGRIEKQVDGDTLTRRFIRADVFSSEDDAVEVTFRKARQIIEQNGAGLFDDGVKERQV